MYTALSGQIAAMKHLEVLANNLANMNTTGFRSERIIFEQVMARQFPSQTGGALKSDIQQASKLQTNNFSGIKGSYTDFSQGTIETTGNPLDLSIQGKGFFVINTPEGTRYTRAGNFRLDTSNRLVTQDGHPVQGTSGDLVIDPKAEIQVSGEGDITADKISIGRVRVAEIRPDDVTRESASRFKLKDGAVAQEVEGPTIRSRAVEGSNVNAVRELTDLIMASRIFEGFNKARDANSQMNEQLNGRVGTTQG